jgi:hypothetical protein
MPAHRSAFATILLASATATSAFAGSDGPIAVEFAAPWADRWNYPFNPTPGTRATASVFGNEPGGTMFDNRDGQMIVGFLTASQLPTGLSPDRYEILDATLVLEFSSDLTLAYDPTPDPWPSFVAANDPAWIPDADAGEAVEVFGVGFRNGMSRAAWLANTPFTVAGQNVLNPGVRSAFALGSRDGAAVDVSNSVRERWDPAPFATGTIDGLKPGELIPVGTEMRFDLASADPFAASYLQGSLADGKLLLSITSLARVVQQGSAFPAFYCNESPLVQGGFAKAARLSMTVRIRPACRAADLDCDGTVGPADLAALLGAWGTAGGPADLDADGSVGAGDLTAMLASWG